MDLKIGKTTNVIQSETEVTLHLIQRYVAEEYPDYSVVNERLKLEIRNNVCRMAKQLILCEDLPTEPLKEFKAIAHFDFPETPWQHFKGWYLPMWFKNRFPVRLMTKDKEVMVKMSAVYPKLPIAFKDHGGYKFHYTE